MISSHYDCLDRLTRATATRMNHHETDETLTALVDYTEAIHSSIRLGMAEAYSEAAPYAFPASAKAEASNADHCGYCCLNHSAA